LIIAGGHRAVCLPMFFPNKTNINIEQ